MSVQHAHAHVHGRDERNDVGCVSLNVVTSSSDWDYGCTSECLNWWRTTVDEAEDLAAVAYVSEYVMVANGKCEDEVGSAADDPDDDVNDLDPGLEHADDSAVWKARALVEIFAWPWVEIDSRLHLRSCPHLHSRYCDYYVHVS